MLGDSVNFIFLVSITQNESPGSAGLLKHYLNKSL